MGPRPPFGVGPRPPLPVAGGLGATRGPGPPLPLLLPPPLVAALHEELSSIKGKGGDEKSEAWESRQQGVRLLQTVCKLIAGVLLRNWYSIKPQLYQFLPMLALNESSELEPELARDCNIALACMATAIVPVKCLPVTVSSLDSVTDNCSWRAKTAMLEFLQVCVFTNLGSFLSLSEQARTVLNIVTKLLKDERVEVREKASSVLGGLLHCCFVPSLQVQERADNFKSAASKKLPKKPKASESQEAFQSRHVSAVLARHSAILGLAAFVHASPYDIPSTLPPLLMVLSEHLHDPAPIPATVKKLFQEFKRTHQDNWEEHKSHFTEDELTVLTDLLVSPSYYA